MSQYIDKVFQYRITSMKTFIVLLIDVLANQKYLLQMVHTRERNNNLTLLNEIGSIQ
jgi:hypothetical protein